MSRSTYHHGNLAKALVEAGIDLARTGGPDAVVLREVARRAGVSPTAAYRHFAGQQDLLKQIKHRATDMLAERIRAALDTIPQSGNPQDVAIARLLAGARAYIDFARDEPGCFATAFRRTEGDTSFSDNDAEMAEDDAFRMVSSLVDGFVTAGLMAPENRPGAEFAAWSAVHGVAILLMEGPLRRLPTEVQDAAAERTFHMIVEGLASPRRHT
ncbi:TetR/AcrR family transcriptional regulator [Streptomyces sp. NPDC088387]|uniref:TetR/AcrR family transcriptional regulator n=1 Tax=Streptomyces sp. NPDC088387 TaxID=3365859 RepID=UPI0037FDE364